MLTINTDTQHRIVNAIIFNNSKVLPVTFKAKGKLYHLYWDENEKKYIVNLDGINFFTPKFHRLENALSSIYNCCWVDDEEDFE